MKVAAYQAPLEASGIADAISLIREQVRACEAQDVTFLCCPEAMLGGLADYAHDPLAIAIDVSRGELARVLAPITGDRVTTIVGFTERDERGALFNAAAVYARGEIVGVYRKLHPAIRRTVYRPGHDTPVFTVGALTFGVLLCRDSTFAEPARVMVARGATLLFIPTNNGMPPASGGQELIAAARTGDVALATTHRVAVVRADVAGRSGALVSHGSTAIVDHDGHVIGAATPLAPSLLVADVPPLDGNNLHM